MDLLLFPGGIVGLVVVLFLYLRKSQEGQRALQIAKTNLTPVEDIERGYAAVATSMRALRKAKNEEHALLLRNWQNSYLTLLHDTDPDKAAYLAKRQGISVESASFILDSSGMRAKDGTLDLPLVEDGPEWQPLPYPKRDPDEELTYTDRRIQSAGAFVRTAPSDTAKTYGTIAGGDVWKFDGWVHGKPISGNDVWFFYIGKNSGQLKFVWSGATTNPATTGLPSRENHYNVGVGTISADMITAKSISAGHFEHIYQQSSFKRSNNKYLL
jgi:hypothetical protein